jgi:ribulose kinase
VIGVDYGTLSGRAIVVRVSDGAELGAAVHEYEHGVMDNVLTAAPAAAGRVRLGPDWALQAPQDYVEVLKTAVPAAVATAGIDPANVIGIGTDFAACTMVPTLADGMPLSALPEFAARPHAYVKLWRHHAAAVAAGAYPDIRAAAMGAVSRAVYLPNEADAAVYDQIYAEYLTLHDYFGRGANRAMKRLRAHRRAAPQIANRPGNVAGHVGSIDDTRMVHQ